MGLDSVELVMAIEEHFGIEIADKDAERLITPGLVVDYICSKLQMADEKRCQSQRAFYLLRRALVKKSGRKRNEISPQTRLRDFFPETNCTEAWSELKRAVDARGWPKLQRPVWMQRTVYSLFWASWFAAEIFLWKFRMGLFSTIIIGFGVAIVVAILLTLSTRSFRYSIPARFVMTGDLVPFVATSNSIQWTRPGVAEAVRAIVIEQLGIKDSIYREDARFIEDLGMG